MRSPGFDGATGWVNTAPLGPDDLAGRVVLVNFWTLTCINWLRQAPYVRAWSEAYRGDGLLVVGVHTPEFGFEHDLDLVRRAVAERAIGYPVVADGDYAIWTAFANHFWPALYFTDRDGAIRDAHFGEGRYEESELVIQALLGIEREPVPVEGTGVEAPADWDNLHTPETYLGDWRGERRAAEPLDLNRWAAAGDWTTEPECLALSAPGGRIAFRFHARDVHLVLSRRSPEPIPFQVRLDGKAPDASHGVDTGEDGAGLLDDGRMYQLVRVDGAVRPRTVEIAFAEPGAEAYAFTFG